MMFVDLVLGAADVAFRRRPLMRRFRKRAFMLQSGPNTFELRIDMGGLGFEWHGALRVDERTQPDVMRHQVEIFLRELEQGFVDEYDRHLAKLEAA
jgi:hypothetical protein